jgi:hypothetical protein
LERIIQKINLILGITYTFAIGGVSCSADSSVVAESFVPVLNLKPLRNSALKPWLPFLISLLLPWHLIMPITFVNSASMPSRTAILVRRATP